jgi:hypothetical protein
MTAKKNSETYSIGEMARPDGDFQLLVFAANGDLVRIHKDPTRKDCVDALTRDGFTVEDTPQDAEPLRVGP